MLFALTLTVAFLGSWIGLRMKLPAGGMVGSMIAVLLFNASTPYAAFMPQAKILGTCVVGCYIGCKVSRDDLAQLRKVLLPALAMVILMVFYNLSASAFLSTVAHIDYGTAVFALAPAGVTDMSLVALDLGLDAAFVSTVQVTRLLMVVSLSPVLIRKSLSFFGSEPGNEDGDATTDGIRPRKRKCFKMLNSREMKMTLQTLLCGIPAGLFGRFIGFPAGTLCFSMGAVMFFNIATGRAFMPLSLRRLAQSVSGALIGLQFSLPGIMALKDDLPFILLLLCGWLVLNQVLGFLLHRFVGLPLVTAFFASAAGGMSDLGIIAVEMGADAMWVTAFQLMRQLGVLIFYPLLIQVFFHTG